MILLQYAYWTALGALSLLIFAKGTGPMIRTTIAMVAVLALSLTLHRFLWPFPSEPYCLTMLVADALAAAVVLIRPAGRAQAAIGITFLVQMGFYAGRLLNGDRADFDNLWWGLSSMAFLQIVLVGGWWLYERAPRRRHLPGGGSVPASSHREGMG
jgi:hypothetical protein